MPKPRTNLGIAASAYVLPGAPVSLQTWKGDDPLRVATAAALAEQGYEHFYSADEKTTLDLATDVVNALRRVSAFDPARMDLAIYTHTIPNGAIPFPADALASLHHAIGFSNASCRVVAQLYCVSLVVALQVADVYAASDPAIEDIAIICVDRNVDENLRVLGRKVLQSDAASILWLKRDWPRNRLIAFETFVDSRYHRGIAGDHKNEVLLNRDYFWHCLRVMRDILRHGEVNGEQLDLLIPHHIHSSEWRGLARCLGIPADRVFMRNFPRVGHAFGSDLVINLTDSGPLAEGAPVLAFTSGLSAAFGGFLISG